ncbi:MAG: BON domain-containing protein [Thermoguttaceae bacterium]
MMGASAEKKDGLVISEEVAAKAKERLKMAPYPPVRNVSCECQDGVLFLRGEVPTFFEKQLAQEAVLVLHGVTRVVNEIKVVGSRTGRDIAAKYRYALQCSDPEERRSRLKEAAEAGHIPAMCDYGLECEDHQERKYWLREAAYEGHVPAIYRYALECSTCDERKRWLRQAADAGNTDAMYAYSQECEDSTEAEYWLRKTACEGHVQAMYDYAMCCTNPVDRRRWLMRAAKCGWEAAIEALDALE